MGRRHAAGLVPGARRPVPGLHQHGDRVFYSSGASFFPNFLEELEQAKDYIFLEYFIIQEGGDGGTILEILERKAAAQGLDVRVLYDDIGCLFTLPKQRPDQRDEGHACRVFQPLLPVLSIHQNNRDHRKICVIDGHTAFTGGVNLSDEYINRVVRFGHWKDSGIRVKGRRRGISP